MAQDSIALIVPMYGKYAYARRTLDSYFEHARSQDTAILIDDGSPEYKQQDWLSFFSGLPTPRIAFTAFPENRGLTAAWNEGLRIAKALGSEYAVAGNSDLIFTDRWYAGLIAMLNKGFKLVGPVSNAAGIGSRGLQQVEKHVTTFRVDDDPNYLDMIAEYLRIFYREQPGEFVDSVINGFLLMARTADWWEGAYDLSHVFDPAKRMQGNEEELIRRWHAKGWQTGFAKSSFVFHYRSVTRGDKYLHTGWFRPTVPS